MELNLVSSIAMVLLLASLFALSAIRLLEPTYDPKEPPVLPQKIPYIGHILGLLQHGLNYYKKLRLLPCAMDVSFSNDCVIALKVTFQSTRFKRCTPEHTWSTPPI